MGGEISSYGVSVTTLNDVFLKLEGEAEIEGGGNVSWTGGWEVYEGLIMSHCETPSCVT